MVLLLLCCFGLGLADVVDLLSLWLWVLIVVVVAIELLLLLQRLLDSHLLVFGSLVLGCCWFLFVRFKISQTGIFHAISEVLPLLSPQNPFLIPFVSPSYSSFHSASASSFCSSYD